jgi:hypothetical protein
MNTVSIYEAGKLIAYATDQDPAAFIGDVYRCDELVIEGVSFDILSSDVVAPGCVALDVKRRTS